MPKRDDFTDWILMHKNIPVARLEIIEETGSIVRVTETLSIDHAPVATLNRGQIGRVELNNWLSDRSIPASRQNISKFLAGLGISSSVALALRSYGLSLSDQYWVRPAEVDVLWEAVNFFQNDFSDDIGEILFQNKDSKDPSIDFRSPDNSSDGWLQKRWIIRKGKRVLVKGGSGYFEQEPYNEEIAANIMAKLNIDHVPYWLESIKGKACSLCENFITEDTELITAWRIQRSVKQRSSDSDFQHLLKCCEKMGIGDMRRQLEQMMVVDYIIANTDRHWGNFGFIRDANTLEWRRFAPIYDSGTSLWHDKHNTLLEVESKSFTTTHRKKIRLVEDLSWYEPILKKEIVEIVMGTLNKHPFMSNERMDMIAEGVSRKMDFITELARELSQAVVFTGKYK